MRKALDAACRDAAIERFATVDFAECARRFFENQFTPQAFLAWLAKQGEPPSKHIVAWAKANGISVPEVPVAAPVQGMAAAQGEAAPVQGMAAAQGEAAPVQGMAAAQGEAAPVPPAAAQRRIVQKRAVLIAEFQGEYPSIASYLNEKSRNGLAEAAETPEGFDVEAVRHWIIATGRSIKAPRKEATIIEAPRLDRLIHRMK